MSHVTVAKQRAAQFQLARPYPRELDARSLPPLKIGSQIISRYSVQLPDRDQCGYAMGQGLLVSSKGSKMPTLYLADLKETLQRLAKKLASPGVTQQYLKLNIYVRAPPDPCNPKIGLNASKALIKVKSPALSKSRAKSLAAPRAKTVRTKGARNLGMKKYAKRQSPLESATAYAIGFRKIGLNGKLWVIAADKNGIHRWRPVNNKLKKTLPRSKKELKLRGPETKQPTKKPRFLTPAQLTKLTLPALKRYYGEMIALEVAPEEYGFDNDVYYNAKVGFSNAYKELSRRGTRA